jgi:hypothetical protein
MPRKKRWYGLIEHAGRPCGRNPEIGVKLLEILNFERRFGVLRLEQNPENAAVEFQNVTG